MEAMLVKAQTTRTLNPLPFQDLEPHRFEDLVRQLAYDFRVWKRLEATGRSGSDEGQDIRGIEVIDIDSEPAGDGEEAFTSTIERLWIFQCKREKNIGPKRIAEIVNETLPILDVMPFGFVLAVACDVSKAARDEFRNEMMKRSIEEFALWAKGELEDMLVLPKNDRLLFAYFNLSLEPRRRSLTTSLRAQISIKKQLLTLFDKARDPVLRSEYLLLRDPSDECYPPEEDEKSLATAKPRYIHCRYLDLNEPNCLCVLIKAHPAWLTPDRKHWDALYTVDLEAERKASMPLRPGMWKAPRDPGFLYLREYAFEEDICELWVVGLVPLDRVLAIDPHGDRYFRMPHLFVEFLKDLGPFKSVPIESLVKGKDPIEMNGLATRKQLFPEPIPSLPYPVPKELDHSAITTATALPEKVAGEFTKIIANIPRGSAEDIGKAEWEEERRRKFQRFTDWRDEVVVPVFAKFVRALREAGEEGRIATRAVPPNDEGYGTVESIELRVCIRAYGPEEPRVWSAGRICATLAHSHEFSLTIFPEPEENSQRGKWPKMEDCTTERIEAEVLGLLRTLVGPRSRRFRY